MKTTWKLSSLAILALIFSYSCSRGNSKPTFVFKKAAGDGLAAQVGEIKISKEELMSGIESDLYEAELKMFNIKFNKLQGMLMEEFIKKDPKSKGLSNDEYLDKYITSSIKISDKQINAFIAEKKIPKQHINADLKEKIVRYLREGEKKDAVDAWLGKKTKDEKIKVFFDKPRRPTFNVVGGDAPYTGDKDAKVEIVEFSDFQCPFCSKATSILKEVKDKYGKKVKVSFKQYPLPFHNQAKGAANAALCAYEQGNDKFWRMHDAMFADQSKLSIDDLKKTAKSLGLDTAKFNKCVDGNKYASQVEADIEYGSKNGVKSTPTFFVNGQLISGAQPIEVFTEIIDEELK